MTHWTLFDYGMAGMTASLFGLIVFIALLILIWRNRPRGERE
jgi:hypothetical protein